jgi:DNA-binding winged helix-turn-helix (wHTH) protein
MRTRFGDCQLDTDTRELTRGGQAQRLTPKAFALLSFLVEQRPRALSRAELHDHVWPETFVGRSSLARLVHEIRAAIGDDADAPRLLRTVGGVGYAFSADVSGVSQHAPRAVEPERRALAERRKGWRVVARGRPQGLGPHMQGARVAVRLRLADGRELELGLQVVDVLSWPAVLPQSEPDGVAS